MCHHNFVQHNGCGHIGESHDDPWTLCAAATHRLSLLRGPNSPPLSPSFAAPPKRSASTRRFLSLSRTLSRSAAPGPRAPGTGSAPGSPRVSAGPEYFAAATAAGIDSSALPAHQLSAVKCAAPTKRTRVSSEMNVCKECLRWIGDMRSCVARYDKTGSIRGTSAFEEFLRWRGEGGTAGGDEGDCTVPLGDAVDGVVLGAREAIVLGHPEGRW